MKRFALYLGLATALVASCSIQEEDVKTPLQDDTVFYASFEQPAEEGTRVYANEDLLLRWTSDDRVSIFNRVTFNQQYRFLGETGDNAGGFNRVLYAEFITGNPIEHVVSVYPYREGTRISEDEVLTVTLPEEQTYNRNTFGLGANTMVAVSSDDFLQYKNVGGYLLLKLYGEEVFVSSIVLRGNRVEKLAGKAQVTMPMDGVPSVQMSGESTTEVTLTCKTPVALGATADNSTDFWIVLPPMTFQEGFTISVFGANGGCFEKTTTKSVTIQRNTLTKMSPTEVSLDVSSIPIPEAVDLGLSVKWASFNIGATAPEDAGYFYAWGETKPKDRYDWSTYKWAKGTSTSLTKYSLESTEGYNGFTDGKIYLDPEDDAARVNLGGNWRMPTRQEATELINNCTWVWTTVNGVNGYKVIGRGSKFIFLPAEGYMQGTTLNAQGSNAGYWLSQLYRGTTNQPLYLWMASSSSTNKLMYAARSRGHFIRPVYSPAVEGISLDASEVEIPLGKRVGLRVNITPAEASIPNLVWTSSDPYVASVVGIVPIPGTGQVLGGSVTGVSSGVATITVATEDGRFSASCVVYVNPALKVEVVEPTEQVFNGDRKNARFEISLEDRTAWEQLTVSTGYCTVLETFEENNAATFIKQIDAIQSGIKTYVIEALLKNGKTVRKEIYLTVTQRRMKDFFWGIYEDPSSLGDLSITSCSAKELVTEHLSGVVSLDHFPVYPDKIEFRTTYRSGTMWFMYPTEWDTGIMAILGGGYLDYDIDFVRRVDDSTNLYGTSYTIRYISSSASVDDFLWEIYMRP